MGDGDTDAILQATYGLIPTEGRVSPLRATVHVRSRGVGWGWGAVLEFLQGQGRIWPGTAPTGRTGVLQTGGGLCWSFLWDVGAGGQRPKETEIWHRGSYVH